MQFFFCFLRKRYFCSHHPTRMTFWDLLAHSYTLPVFSPPCLLKPIAFLSLNKAECLFVLGTFLVELPERVLPFFFFSFSCFHLPFFHWFIKHVHQFYIPSTCTVDFYTTSNRYVCVYLTLFRFLSLQLWQSCVKSTLPTTKYLFFLQFGSFCSFGHGLWPGSHFALGIKHYNGVAIFQDVIITYSASFPGQPLLPGKA